MTIKHLSDELAEEHDVPEPEMFGFLLGLELKGIHSENIARNRVQSEFTDA